MPLEIVLAPRQATVGWGNRCEFGILGVYSLPVTGVTLVCWSFFSVLEVFKFVLSFSCSQSLAGGEDLIYASVHVAFDQQRSKGGNSTLNKERSHADGDRGRRREWGIGGNWAVCIFGFPGVPTTRLVPQKEGGVFAMSPVWDESLTNDMHRVPGGGKQLCSSWLMNLAWRKELEAIPGMKQKA